MRATHRVLVEIPVERPEHAGPQLIFERGARFFPAASPARAKIIAEAYRSPIADPLVIGLIDELLEMLGAVRV